MNKKGWIKVVFMLGALAAHSDADIIWPSEFDWIALQQATNLYHDTAGDNAPAPIDLIGTTDTYSAGYWALAEDGYINDDLTEDAFMFRLRLGGDGEKRKFVWQVSLDTDGDASNVEWILQLVQSGKSSGHTVGLIQTADGGPTLGDVDIGSNPYAWLGDTGLYSRWTAIPDSTDYYVDIAVPWTTFTSITGVTELEQIRTVLSTSTTHTGIKGDVPLGTGLSNPISTMLSDNIPEPAVASLLLSSGIGFLVFRRMFDWPTTDCESPESSD